MDNKLYTITIVVPMDLKRQYAMAKATGLLKATDFQEMMRRKIQEALDSLITNSKSTNNNTNTREHILNKNTNLGAAKEKKQDTDHDPIATEVFNMFNR